MRINNRAASFFWRRTDSPPRHTSLRSESHLQHDRRVLESNFWALRQSDTAAADTCSCWSRHSTAAPSSSIAATDLNSSASSRITSWKDTRSLYSINDSPDLSLDVHHSSSWSDRAATSTE